MRKVLVAFVLLIAAAAAFYFLYWQTDRGAALREIILGEPAQAVSTDPAVLANLEVRVLGTYADNYGVARVRGDVTNNAEEPCALAVIRLDIRDRGDALTKQLEANVRDIPPGGSVSFDIEVGVYRGAFGAEPVLVGAVF